MLMTIVMMMNNQKIMCTRPEMHLLNPATSPALSASFSCTVCITDDNIHLTYVVYDDYDGYDDNYNDCDYNTDNFHFHGIDND